MTTSTTKSILFFNSFLSKRRKKKKGFALNVTVEEDKNKNEKTLSVHSEIWISLSLSLNSPKWKAKIPRIRTRTPRPAGRTTVDHNPRCSTEFRTTWISFRIPFRILYSTAPGDPRTTCSAATWTWIKSDPNPPETTPNTRMQMWVLARGRVTGIAIPLMGRRRLRRFWSQLRPRKLWILIS